MAKWNVQFVIKIDVILDGGVVFVGESDSGLSPETITFFRDSLEGLHINHGTVRLTIRANGESFPGKWGRCAEESEPPYQFDDREVLFADFLVLVLSNVTVVELIVALPCHVHDDLVNRFYDMIGERIAEEATAEHESDEESRAESRNNRERFIDYP